MIGKREKNINKNCTNTGSSLNVSSNPYLTGMEKEKIIQKTIEINAPIDKVWRVFTDPTVTMHMGGEYVTDWKVGSSLGWRGKDGNMYTSGIILEIEKEKLIKHNLFNIGQNKKILSVITYRFIDKDGQTSLNAREELDYEMTDEQYAESMEGWDFALASVKETAEKFNSQK